MDQRQLIEKYRPESRQQPDLFSENMDRLERLSLRKPETAETEPQSPPGRDIRPRRPQQRGASLGGRPPPIPTMPAPLREDTIKQIIGQCESHVALILPQLREIRHVRFPASSQGDGLRWSTLLAWLQDTVAQCEDELKHAIKEQQRKRAAKCSIPLQEANPLIRFLEKSVPTLPVSTLVGESTLLDLSDPSGGSSGDLGAMLDSPSFMTTEMRRHRARADMADLSTGIHGYKALILELNELGIVQIPDGTLISLPDNKGQWLSTLDALESKLMNHSRQITLSRPQGRSGPRQEEEARVKMGQVIRLRGWIVAARRQHAGTTQRGPYYKPEPEQ